MNKKHFWTPEEDAVLMEQFKAGVAYKAIAELLGRSYNSVTTRISDLRKAGQDIPFRHLVWTPELDKEVADTVGKNPGNISAAFRIVAEKYNTTPEAVSQRWYNNIKDTTFVFSVFGRYRGAKNRKIYTKNDAKGHNLWRVIKEFFN